MSTHIARLAGVLEECTVKSMASTPNHTAYGSGGASSLYVRVEGVIARFVLAAAVLGRMVVPERSGKVE